jgi:hypothetical protein
LAIQKGFHKIMIPSVFVEFPEFLTAFSQNIWIRLEELINRHLEQQFFWQRQRFLSKISSIVMKTLSIKGMEEVWT